MHREPKVLEAEAQVGKWLDCRARITSKELAPTHSVKNGILENACSTSPKRDAGLGKSVLKRIARLKNILNRSHCSMMMLILLQQSHCNERHQKTGRPVLDAYSSNTRQLGWVFQGMEPPKCSPIRCVKFTKAVARHADIRDQNPSLGMICPGDPHQRNPKI